MSRLFPPGALAAEFRETADLAALLPAEAKHLKRAVPKRVQEFAAGRLCARKLLAEFGFLDFPVEVGDDRQPVWPDTLVGSITHTSGLCAAVLSHKSNLAAVGMDCEVAGSVRPELWPSICTQKETLWLHSLPEAGRMSAATLKFSAKEAFYKCQYPLVRERLNFHDVTVEVLEWGPDQGSFAIHATRSIALAELVTLPLKGHYLYHEQFVTAGIALAAAGALSQ